MGMKGLIYEILADRQKEIIKSLESQIKNKNETILKETQRANEMFKLSYNRKLKIEEQQAEINRLRDDNYELKKIIIQLVNDVEFGEFVNLEAAKKALNDESEEKND